MNHPFAWPARRGGSVHGRMREIFIIQTRPYEYRQLSIIRIRVYVNRTNSGLHYTGARVPVQISQHSTVLADRLRMI
jgi:hypothetical protein